jgi:ribosomal protein S17
MTVLQGIVTKAGVMGKTVTVTVSIPTRGASSLGTDGSLELQVSRKVIHPILLKEMKRHKKFLVHDEHEGE